MIGPFLRASRNTLYARLLRIILFPIAALCLTSFVSLALVRSAYDAVVYRTGSELLNATAAMVERELLALENMALLIAADNTIQSHLYRRLRGDDFLRGRALQDLSTSLLRFDPRKWYVASIRLLDGKGDETIIGRYPESSDPAERDEIIAAAAARGGAPTYRLPDAANGFLVISREVREIETFSLEPLGTVSVYLDLPALLREQEKLVFGYSAKLHVASGGMLIASADPSIPLGEVLPSLTGERGYLIAPIGGAGYFVSWASAERADRLYISTTPIDSVTAQIRLVKTLEVIAYLAAILIVSFTAIRFARKVTEPIALLSQKVKEVERGNFAISLDLEELDRPADEIAAYCRDFDLAVKKIKELIDENYVKRLQVQEADYRILQTQINPHFLYNTLDSVKWLAKMNGEPEIAAMIGSLGALLRSSLRCGEKTVPIERELELLEHYVRIQSIRFRDRFVFEIRREGDFDGYGIPPFTFQPLVENSIRYALEEGSGTCSVTIELRSSECGIECAVHDDGPGFPERTVELWAAGQDVPPTESGIGLANISHRLTATHGPLARPLLATRAGGGAEVRFLLPVGNRTDNCIENSGGIGIGRENEGA